MGKLKIHSENILPIIKQWLYSDRDIFLRELVSNGSDALQKLIRLSKEENFELDESSLKVEVLFDLEKKTLTIQDNGLGMTSDEVETYIAQIAFSGAEEFVQKYQNGKNDDEIIGHFGLGFYSAFMVAKQVEIETLSYREDAKPALWTCDGSIDYELIEGTRTTRGTTITLHLDDDEFLKEILLRDTLLKYCRFLPFPLYFNDTLMNAEEPLFNKAPSDCSDEDYIAFYQKLYPLEPEPIFWIHLNVDYPFNLKGILYFPKLDHLSQQTRKNIQLFCHRIFVSDNCNALLPDFLTALKGAIDSPDIPLNVSRSTLQMDQTVRRLSSHIAKKVADRLAVLSTEEPELFIKKWPDIELVLKLGALQDEKFYDRIKETLIWKNIQGEWTNLNDYLERASDKTIYYTQDSHSPCLELFKTREVLIFNSHLDSPLTSQLERKLTGVSFKRIDASLEETHIDRAKEDTLLDSEGRTKAFHIAEFFKSKLNDKTLKIEAKSLSSDEMPALILIDENMRRMREYFQLSNQPLPKEMGSNHTFVVNTNNSLINRIYSLKEKKPELASSLVHELYGLTLLSQKELKPEELPELIKKTQANLSALLSEEFAGQ